MVDIQGNIEEEVHIVAEADTFVAEGNSYKGYKLVVPERNSEELEGKVALRPLVAGHILDKKEHLKKKRIKYTKNINKII